MFKSLIIIAWVGFSLLVITIIVLGSLNWSDRFYTPLAGLGVALAGTLAGLITVVAMLNGDTFGSAFTTFIIVNTDNHLPVWPNDITRSDIARNPNSLMHRLLEYGGLASPKIQNEAGKEITLFEGPHNDSDETVFYQELLQYKFLIEIRNMLNPNPWLTLTVGPPGPSVGSNKAFKLSEVDERPLLDVCADISKARFANNPVEKVSIESYPSRLPKGTKVTLQRIASVEKTGNEKHAVILTKPYFFTIEIVIEPGIYSGQRGIPAGSGVSPELATRCKILMFQISMVAKFEKVTTGNYRTEELKNWARWVFEQLESKFADNTPEE